MAKEPYLKPSKEHREFFQCSVCELAFKPNPNDQGEMIRLFNEHLRIVHKEPREDVNQAAARIVREATERD